MRLMANITPEWVQRKWNVQILPNRLEVKA